MDKHPVPPDIDPEPADSAYTPPPPKLPNSFRHIQPKHIAPLIALALFLPALVVSVLNRQSLFGFAKKPSCTPVAYVRVHPGEVITYLQNEPTQMSALAYDSDNQPVQNKVVYRWGISSTNSVGDLKPRQELALFMPQNPGEGNIWVQAKNNCTKEWFMSTVPVTVTELPPPTPTPQFACNNCDVTGDSCFDEADVPNLQQCYMKSATGDCLHWDVNFDTFVTILDFSVCRTKCGCANTPS